MFYDRTCYIGIDPTAGQRPFVYAALDQDLRLLALGHCEFEEVLAFVAGQRQAYVAICAPSRPNQGLLQQEEVRHSLNPAPKPGRWVDFRLAEYLLRQHNIPIPQTPGRVEDCPNWMQMGFKLRRRLDELGYKTYPDTEAGLQCLEVYPHGAYTTILGVAPFAKHSLEGRIQRQVVLQNASLKVPDAMLVFEEITRHKLLNGILELEALYSAEELDALMAAYTAWKAANGAEEVSCIGDAGEGQIVLPVAELKRRY